MSPVRSRVRRESAVPGFLPFTFLGELRVAGLAPVGERVVAGTPICRVDSPRTGEVVVGFMPPAVFARLGE